MKFFPATRALYSDDDEFIKVLECPLRLAWDELAPQPASRHRLCGECERAVLDTSELSDAEVQAIVLADRATCLCISAHQENVAVMSGDAPRQAPQAGVGDGTPTGPTSPT